MNSQLRSSPVVASILALILAACRSACVSAPQPALTTPTSAPPPRASPFLPARGDPPAEFAGAWYPAEPDALAETADKLLAAGPHRFERRLVSLIVPHVGWAYSGPVAAAGFRQLQQGSYDVAVIIGTDHQEPISNRISVWARRLPDAARRSSGRHRTGAGIHGRRSPHHV